uniref:Terminase n=1 Tax=viral metagenome TaxID=1070528 RepID=A0A6H1ZMH8_9ZZZZ
MKYSSIEEVNKIREDTAEKFEGELPSYLQDYFDEAEMKQLKTEYHQKRRSWEEIKEFHQKNEEEFWEDNEFEIKKKGVTHANPIFQDLSPHNEERVEDERDLTASEVEVLKRLCEEDLYLFAVRYFPHYLKKPSSEFHRYLYKKLTFELTRNRMGRDLKLAIAAPRGNAKSSLVSAILPLWCIAYNKKKFIIMVSNTAGMAEDFLTDIKAELEGNSKLMRDFPHVCGKGPRWRSAEIITSNNIKVLALGTGSQIRGRKFGVDRPNLLIFDDLEDKDMLRSPTLREFTRFTWFNKDALFAGGEKGEGSDFIVVGTILGKDSLLNSLLDPTEYPGWDTKRFKAVEKFSDSPLWDEWEELYKNTFDINRLDTAREFFEAHEEEMLEGTKVLWPEGNPYYDLMEIFVNDKSAFFSERQNSPVDPTKLLVLKDDLHFENLSTPDFKESSKKFHFFGSLDPSLGKKKGTGDYSCIVTLARDPSTGTLYVIGIDLKRRSVDSQIESILESHTIYHYRLFSIETNAFQFVVAENLRKISKKEGMYVPIEEVHNYSDKTLRIEGIVPFLKDGTIVFDSHKYKHTQQYRIGVDQLLTFTGDGSDRFDDFPDALEMAFRIAKKSRFRTLTKQTIRKAMNG